MDFNQQDFAVALLDTTPDAVIYADALGKIRFWNKGAERIFGFTEAEALGQPLDIIIPDNLRARHHQGHEKTMRTGETRFGGGETLAVPALRKDGTRISVEFTIVPFRDASGAMVGLAATLRDVTARFEELRALRRRVADLPPNPILIA